MTLKKRSKHSIFQEISFSEDGILSMLKSGEPKVFLSRNFAHETANYFGVQFPILQKVTHGWIVKLMLL